MWRQADRNTLQLATITSYGWNIVDDVLIIDWDSEENQAAVNERVVLLTKGCKCKTGCMTGRCGCKRKGQCCSEGCSGLHCSNLPDISGQEECDLREAAHIEMEENRGMDDIDEEMETIFGLDELLANESDLDSDLDSEPYSEDEDSNGMLSD